MKKQIFLRGLLGGVMGIAISTLVSLIVYAFIGNGAYNAFVPDLAVTFGSDYNAMLMQTLLSFVTGASWGASSIMWEIESWSLAKSTALNFLTNSAVSLPIAYVLGWMPRNAAGIVSYIVMFIAIYVSIWAGTYFFIRKNLSEANSKLNRM